MRVSVSLSDRDRHDWRTDAACADVSPDIFWPNEANLADIAWAKAVCHRCPVVEECLAWAITHSEGDGIYGGMTPQERSSLTRAAMR